MRLRVSFVVLPLFVLSSLPPTAQGQRRGRGSGGQLSARVVPEVGIRGGFDFDLEAVGIGTQVRLPAGPFAELVPSGDYYFGSDQTAWQANLDFVFRFGFRQVLYGGVGGAIAHRAFEVDNVPVLPTETKAAFNLSVGIATPRFRRARLRPYAEARWSFVNEFDTQFAIVAGMNLALGR